MDIYAPNNEPHWIHFLQYMKETPIDSVESLRHEFCAVSIMPNGYVRTAEHNKALAISRIGNKNCVGRKISEETRRKMGEKNRGKQARLGGRPF